MWRLYWPSIQTPGGIARQAQPLSIITEYIQSYPRAQSCGFCLPASASSLTSNFPLSILNFPHSLFASCYYYISNPRLHIFPLPCFSLTSRMDVDIPASDILSFDILSPAGHCATQNSASTFNIGGPSMPQIAFFCSVYSPLP